MLRLIVGVFFILHGLVFMLYAGHSWGLYELSSGLTWPAGSWAFSKLLGAGAIKTLASVLCTLTAIGFVASGAGVLLKQAWWQSAAVGTAIFSIVVFILLWDGGLQRLDDKGGIGLLINLVILTALLVFHWPKV